MKHSAWLQRLAPYALASALLIGLKQSPALELGWIDQFNANNNTQIWDDWLPGNGLYGKVRYRF